MNLDVDAPGTEFRIYPHVTERVDMDRRGICFPLKLAYDRANQSFDGRTDAVELRYQGGSCVRFDEFGVEKKCLFSRIDQKTVFKGEGEWNESTQAAEAGSSDSTTGSLGAHRCAEDASSVESGAPSLNPSPGTSSPDPPPVEVPKEQKWYIDSLWAQVPC